jgi:hypothetical protein
LNGGSDNPVISPDGRYVVFGSSASDLGDGVADTNGARDVFLFDRDTGAIVLVSRTAGDLMQTGNSDSDERPPARNDEPCRRDGGKRDGHWHGAMRAVTRRS